MKYFALALAAIGSSVGAQAAVQPACVAGPFMVFFDSGKDSITPQAAAILDHAASAYRSCGEAQAMLAGHTDRAGAEAANVALSERRVANVRTYLAGRGIPDGM